MKSTQEQDQCTEHIFIFEQLSCIFETWKGKFRIHCCYLEDEINQNNLGKPW